MQSPPASNEEEDDRNYIFCFSFTLIFQTRQLNPSGFKSEFLLILPLQVGKSVGGASKVTAFVTD